MNPPVPSVRPYFWTVDQAQEFLATRFDQITPWLCAQRARAFLFLARRFMRKGRWEIAVHNWRSAGAFVALGKRIRAHGPRGAVRFPSDWMRSEKFLRGNTVVASAARLREDFVLAREVADSVHALELLETVLATAIRLRPEFILAAEKQRQKEKEIGRKLFPIRPFTPTKLARRVKEAA